MKYVIPEAPVPCQRHRMSKGRAYDPQKAIKDKWRWILHEQHRGKVYSGVPLVINITFYMPIPAGLSDKKRAELEGLPHTKRPDRDNLEKFLLDCCTSVIVEDDNLFFSGSTQKIYDKNPRVEFEILKHGEEYL